MRQRTTPSGPDSVLREAGVQGNGTLDSHHPTPPVSFVSSDLPLGNERCTEVEVRREGTEGSLPLVILRDSLTEFR